MSHLRIFEVLNLRFYLHFFPISQLRKYLFWHVFMPIINPIIYFIPYCVLGFYMNFLLQYRMDRNLIIYWDFLREISVTSINVYKCFHIFLLSLTHKLQRKYGFSYTIFGCESLMHLHVWSSVKAACLFVHVSAISKVSRTSYNSIVEILFTTPVPYVETTWKIIWKHTNS